MRPRVLIEVSGGVAEVTDNADDIDVSIFDWDNYADDPDSLDDYPAWVIELLAP